MGVGDLEGRLMEIEQIVAKMRELGILTLDDRRLGLSMTLSADDPTVADGIVEAAEMMRPLEEAGRIRLKKFDDE